MMESAAQEEAARPPPRGMRGAWRFGAVIAFLLLSLFMLSDATRNPARFGEFYTPLIFLTLIGISVLSLLIIRDIIQLAQGVRAERPGARLTVRMVTVFSLLAVTPVVVIFYFSVHFVHRNVDSWLDVRIEQALERALEWSRASLNRNMRERLKQIELLAVQLSDLPESDLTSRLHDAFEMIGGSELTLMSSRGRVIATSADTNALVPNPPDEAALLQLRQSGTYVGLDPIDELGLHLRVVVDIANPTPGEEARFVQALFPVGAQDGIEGGVQGAFERYRDLIVLRSPLKTSFMLTLFLVLMVSLLGAAWAAVFAARRLTAPLRGMAAMTRSVAAGDYEAARLPIEGPGEIGFLVESFNDMTHQLALARDEASDSHRQLEEQRTYLEAVLSRLSSGVLTTGDEARLITFNQMAETILAIPLDEFAGARVDALGRRHPHLGRFADVLGGRIRAGRPDWREQIELDVRSGKQILMCRGTVLPGSDPSAPGHVIVFDDVTTLIDAQRSQAWEEVARRLAHEIKNPLTPIQLSAERLRHKYLARMEGSEGESLDRLTRTIVQQVENLKDMVNAFSRYARTPERHTGPTDINELVGDVAELYRDSDGRPLVHLALCGPLPVIEVDPGQLRQVLHNLIRNAEESCTNRSPGDGLGAERSAPPISIETRPVTEGGLDYVETRVSDRGPGIGEEVLGRLFEPYVSTKPKGTGIGLAIVKKIVDEHDGVVWAENRRDGGASVVIRLPVAGLAAISSSKYAARETMEGAAHG